MADCAIALVTDNLTYGTSYQAFERPPDTTMLYSLIPRGVRRFFISTDVSAKPINDTIDVFITATLPLNFAYLMRSFNLQFTGDTASDWNASVTLRLLNHIPEQGGAGVSEQLTAPMTLFTPGSGSPQLAVRDFHDIRQFAGPFWSISQTGQVTFRARIANVAAAAGAAAFVISHCEFYEFDLTQAQRYFINTPIPVIAR